MAESPGKQISDKKQLTASGAEVVFLVLLIAFGLGVCVWVERGFTWAFSEPKEQQFADPQGIKEKQERLTRLENGIKDAEKQLDAVALEQLKQTAALRSLEKSHPEIGKPREGTANSISVEAEKNYETAKIQQQAADEYAGLLNARITSLKKEAEETAKTLEPQKQAAAKGHEWQKRIYLGVKFAVSFLLALVVTWVALLIGASIFKRVAKKDVWIGNGDLPIALVTCALLILLAYQAFEIAGAVLIGMFVFFLVLRKMRWSPGLGDKGTE